MTQKKYILNTALVLVSLFLLFAISEVAMRIYYNSRHEQAEPECLQADAKRIYKFKSDSETCNTNDKGYVDYNYPDNKTGKRIVVIGDSVAAGLTIPFGKSFPKLLEKKLNADSDSAYEVIVLAVPGYSTSQEISLLKDEAFQYTPDLIIFAYHLNDPAHPLFHNAGGQVGIYFRKPASYALFYLERLVFRTKSQLTSIHSNCPQTPWCLFLHCVYWPEVMNSVNQIMTVSRDKSTPVLFGFLPLLLDPADRNGLDGLYRKLTDLAEDKGAQSINLMQPFQEYDVEDVRLTDDPWHPNEKGHRIIADKLYSYFLDNPL